MATAKTQLPTPVAVGSPKLPPAALRIASAAQRYVGFRTVITLTVMACVIGVGVVTVTAVHRNLRENKTRDVWSILFLELEHRARDLSERLLDAHAVPKGPTTAYEIGTDDTLHRLSGPDLGVTKLKDFGVEEQSDLVPWNLVKSRDRSFVLRHTQDKGRQLLDVNRAGAALRLESADAISKQSKVYISTRQGQLIYTNSPDVTQDTYVSRTLVQKFITLPVWQGQLDLADPNGESFYGYFTEVPGTNLVVFAETSKSVVTEAVDADVRKLIIKVLTTLGLAILALQGPLLLLLRPVSSLVDAVKEFARGNFDARPKMAGLGEIRVLSETFSEMAVALKEREATIRRLMVEQQDKQRLESELALAKSIQDNLLPLEAVPHASGLKVDATYLPATEVAGDWYGYFHCPEADATAIAIVDISGHGAGASMFTAIAASLFEDLNVRFAESRDPRTFFSSFNHQLLRYGRGKWTASAQLAIYWQQRREVTIVNAGHPAPIVAGAGDALRFLGKMNSTPLGLVPELNLAVVTMPLTADQLILMYTDGLSECRSPDGKVLGAKRLLRSANDGRGDAPDLITKRLMRLATSYAGGLAMRDDICIIAARSF